MKPSRKEYEEIRQQEAANKRCYYEKPGIAAAPHTICLSVNNNCFMRCKMCDIGETNARNREKVRTGYFASRYVKGTQYREFPLDRIKDLVDEMVPYQPIFKANFVEPLLYKQLWSAGEYIKKKGLKFYTITNGWMLKKAAPWLVDIETNVIRISLDGTREIHDRIRGNKGSFDRTIEGIRELIHCKKRSKQDLPIIGICFTISNYNYSNLSDFLELLEKEEILYQVYVNFNHLQYTTTWEVEQSKAESALFDNLEKCSVDNIVFSDIDVDGLSEQIEKIYAIYDQDQFHYYFSPWLKKNDLKDYYDPNYWMFPRTKCFLPWYCAQIEIDGDVGVYGHCILPALGNLMNRGFMEVWNSPRAVEIRRALQDVGSFPACNKCLGTLYPLRGRE